MPIFIVSDHCVLSPFYVFAPSFDHLICPRQHVRRNRQADLLCGFEIDDEIEFRRLLDRKIGGFSAFQDLVDIHGGAPVQVEKVVP